MNQYFENNPSLKEDKHFIKYYINGEELLFLSDSGVFSKDYIDFGSNVLIKNILKEDIKGEGIDLGCGIGVIGISVMHFNPNTKFMFIDVNDKAIELTKTNLKSYKLEGEVINNNGLENLPENSKDFIITNPPIRAGKSVIYKFYDDSIKVLKDNGVLFVVIQKKQGAPSTIEKLKTLYRNVEIIDKEKGYFIIKASK